MKLSAENNFSIKTLLVFVFIFAGVLNMSGCQSDVTGPKKIDVSEMYPDQRPDIKRGKEVFETYCIFCHGVQGNGQGVAQSVIKEKPCDFTDRASVHRHSPRQYFNALTNGSDNAMPGFGRMSEQDRWNVLFYERTFALEQGDIEAGSAIYKKKCISCHGALGDGRGKAGATFKTPPKDYRDLNFQVSKSDKDLVKVITSGLGNMPTFKTALSEEEMYQVVSFIRTFGYKGMAETQASTINASVDIGSDTVTDSAP